MLQNKALTPPSNLHSTIPSFRTVQEYNTKHDKQKATCYALALAVNCKAFRQYIGLQVSLAHRRHLKLACSIARRLLQGASRLQLVLQLQRSAVCVHHTWLLLQTLLDNIVRDGGDGLHLHILQQEPWSWLCNLPLSWCWLLCNKSINTLT